MSMQYTKLFDAAASTQRAVPGDVRGDRPEGVAYQYDDDIELAVNVALATGRPLLVSGDPGTGKTSLAYDVARRLGWRYYATAITSRTQARDLLWEIDSIRRLSDAHANRARAWEDYRVPGPLWWAFEPASARAQATLQASLSEPPATVRDPGAGHPWLATPVADDLRAVVLLDEIDKAEPDVPNDLLQPLGSFEFTVDERLEVQAAAPPLVFITTNGERELPRAFLRRCIRLRLHAPGTDRLLDIAAAHAKAHDRRLTAKRKRLHRAAVERYQAIRELLHESGELTLPGTAELLDVIEACEEAKLDIRADSTPPAWVRLLRTALLKGDVALDDDQLAPPAAGET